MASIIKIETANLQTGVSVTALNAHTDMGGGIVTVNGGLVVNLRRSNLGHAPEQVFIDVGYDDAVVAPTTIINTFDQRLVDSDIWIDYGDAGSRYDNALRVHEDQRNANETQGFLGSHVYETAMTATITVYALYRPAGVLYVWTDDVVITDESTVYDDTTTVLVDQTGTFAGAPAGIPAGQQFTTFTGARDYCRGRADPHRILVENGQTWVNEDTDLDHADLPSLYIRLNDPDGARTLFQSSGRFQHQWPIGRNDVAKVKDLRLVDMDGDGGYDPVALTGTNIYVSGGETRHAVQDWVRFVGDEPSFCLFRGMTSTGFAVHYNELTRSGGGLKGITKTTATGWHDYCVTTSGGYSDAWALMDNNHWQTPGANANGNGKYLPPAAHGPLRAFGAGWVFQDANDKRSGNGWSAASGWASNQEVERLHTSSNGSDIRINIRRSYYEGSRGGVDFGPANGDANTHLTVGACFIGECWFLADCQQQSGVRLWNRGAVVENCVRIVPPTKGGGAISGLHRARWMVQFNSGAHDNTDPNYSSGANYVRGCLDYIVRPMSENANALPDEPLPSTATWVSTNNARYVASGLGYDVGDVDESAGPFTVTTHADLGISPKSSEDHVESLNVAVTVVNSGTPDTAPVWVIPTASSGMIGDGTDGGANDIPRIGILGNERDKTTVADRGPFVLS